MTPLVLDLAQAGRWQDAILRDGSAIRLRPVSAGDEAALREFLEGVSTDSLRQRFFGAVDRDGAAASLADRSHPGEEALVAVLEGEETIVGHAASYRIDAERAEVAFLVADAWQGRGLGSIMFSSLAAAAREQGVAALLAEVLPTNRGMLTVFERSGHPVAIHRSAEAVEVRIETTPLAPALAA